MQATESRPRTRGFGVFELDLRAAELRKHGVRSKLQEQPFQILSLMLEHPGEVVTREELRKKLWPAHTFVDFDRSLNKAMTKLRAALGDSADSPRYVETIPRHGYRFLAPVHVPHDEVATTPSEDHSSEDRRNIHAIAAEREAAPFTLFALDFRTRGGRKRFYGVLATVSLAILAALIFVGILVLQHRSKPKQIKGALPPTDGFYWLTMLIAGSLGTVMGDAIGHSFNSVQVGVPISASIATLALLLIWTARTLMVWLSTTSYWVAVVAVRWWGTNVGDVSAFFLSLIASAVITGLALAILLSASAIIRFIMPLINRISPRPCIWAS